MKLIFIRHGESIGNVTYGYISGRTDPAGLTYKGKSQIIRSAWELRHEPITRIIASPVARAQETARILHCYFPQARFETEEWLTELYHGIFEGYRWWEVIHKVPTSWRKNRERYQTAFPGGESMEMMAHRVWDGFTAQLASIAPDDTVLFVSHQAVISSLRYGIEMGGPSTLDTDEKQKQFVSYLNSVQLPNGGAVWTSYSKGAFSALTEYKPPSSLKPNLKNSMWYAKGIFMSHEAISARYMQTASRNAVYQIETPGTARILKVLQNSDTQTIRNQLAVYSYLANQGIDAPIVDHYDASRAFYKSDVLIQDFVKGEVGASCLKKHPDQFNLLLKDIYAVLKKIHAFPVSEVQSFWNPPVVESFLDWKTFMQYNINLSLHMLQLCELDENTKEYMYRELSDLATYLLSDRYTLTPIHGDVGTGNFITTHVDGACRLRRIIDFEWARIGDPLWDFAYFWGWLERNNRRVAAQWYDLIKTSPQINRVNQYRLLFHAWTVRDMLDFPHEKIRQMRGKASLKLLQTSIKLDSVSSIVNND